MLLFRHLSYVTWTCLIPAACLACWDSPDQRLQPPSPPTYEELTREYSPAELPRPVRTAANGQTVASQPNSWFSLEASRAAGGRIHTVAEQRRQRTQLPTTGSVVDGSSSGAQDQSPSAADQPPSPRLALVPELRLTPPGDSLTNPSSSRGQLEGDTRESEESLELESVLVEGAPEAPQPPAAPLSSRRGQDRLANAAADPAVDSEPAAGASAHLGELNSERRRRMMELFREAAQGAQAAEGDAEEMARLDDRANDAAPAPSEADSGDGGIADDQTQGGPAENARSGRRPPLTPELEQLRDKIRRCLAIYYFKPVYVENHSPWGIMHSMLAYGVDSRVHAGGKPVNAAGWLSWNGACRGNRLMELDRQGRPQLRQGPGYQGHPGQFVAMLAQSRVQITHELRVNGREFTVQDLVEQERLQCRRGMELTFPLIGLMHYGESDATWKNHLGETWSIPDLIREEIREPVNGAACGGVHRLMALSFAVRKRLQRNEPLEGEWAAAKTHVDRYLGLTFQLQNPDGSFSTNWFEGRGGDPDRDKRLQTTGHILEWVVFSVREESLAHPKIVAAVEHLADLMLAYPNHPWEIGPRGHALRALALYDELMFEGDYGNREERLAAILKQNGDERLVRDSAVKISNNVNDEFEPRGNRRGRRLFGF